MRKYLSFLLLSPLLLCGLPEEMTVVSGKAPVTKPDGNTMVIKPTDNAVLNYKSFGIGAGETVEFVQNSVHSVVLNRVVGANPSEIFGQLRANGKVFLVNPNGILFGPNSQVNVGSIIASTLDIDDKDFIKGNYRFRLDPKAKNSKIINRGTINVGREGYAVLMAPHIFNEGVISALAGRVALLAGEVVTLDFSGDGLMSFAVLEGDLETAIIEHLGKIAAPQGEVLIRLKTADQLMKSVVNIDGVMIGNAIEKENGIVRIVAKAQIDAPRTALSGRNVEVSGEITAREHLDIEAKDNIRMRSKTTAGNLALKANTISIGATIDCVTVQLEAAKSYLIGGDIKTHNSPIIFNAPVIFSAPEVALSTGSIGGDIAFIGTVDSDPRYTNVNLTLASGSGDILFNAPVGGSSKINLITIANAGNVVASSSLQAGGFIQSAGTGATDFFGPVQLDAPTGLHLNCHIVNIDQPLTTKNGGGVTIINSGPVKIAERLAFQIDGPFQQKGMGEVILGGNITANGPMTFTGPVQLTNTRLIELNAAKGTGDITFKSNVDGPGGLKIVSGSLTFASDIGHVRPLSNLEADTTSSITIGNIGGAKAGVTGRIDLKAENSITFNGAVVNSREHRYEAKKQFVMASGGPTAFISSYSNAPIHFEKGEVHLLAGTHLSVTTTNGMIQIPGVRGASFQNLALNADQGKVFVGAIGMGDEIDHASITGGEVSIFGPIKARRITLNGQKRVFLDADLITTFGDIVFSGPVSVRTLDLKVFSAEKGNITFHDTLDGKGKVDLRAHGGTIRLDGAVGSKELFSEFSAGGKVIDQNNSVNVTGPLTYSGEIRLGGKIKTKMGAVELNGPVIRDNIETVSITTTVFDGAEGKSRGGNVSFMSLLNADVPGRSLTVNAADAIVSFKGAIGKNVALRDLGVTAHTIELADVGGDLPGVANNLNLGPSSLIGNESLPQIVFKGQVCHAGEQKLRASQFIVAYQGQAQFITDSRPLDFEQGTVHLDNGSHLAVNTRGGEFKVVFLKATSHENAMINTGNGRVKIGEVENLGHLSINGGTVAIMGKIQVSTLHIEAENTIQNEIDPKWILADGNVYLNAKGSSVGQRENPIWVKTKGQIYTGARTEAHLEGESSDNVLHSIPSNRPDLKVFNNVEYYDLVLDDYLLTDEEAVISLTPDLFTHVPGGYAHPGAVKPRKAPLYYQITAK